MAFHTRSRQETQIRPSDVYTDSIAPSQAAYETNPANIEDNLNSLRSQAQNFLNRSGAGFPGGNWWDDISVPGTFENGTQRGINVLNTDLHDLERKRILARISQIGNDITIGSAGDQYVILSGTEIPAVTTIAVGTSTTLGTVAAAATAFGTASATDIVSGTSAIRPNNLCVIWNSAAGSTGGELGDVVKDGVGEQLYGLLQSENPADGHTATGTTPDRLQLSFVKLNATADGIILVTAGEMDGVIFDYAPIQRFAFEDIPEDAFLGGNFVDSGVANATRQAGYDNQGIVPVDVNTNSFLDLEGPGLTWQIRDDAEQTLFSIVEGSAGGTSTVRFGTDVDTFDNNAIVNDFANGATIRSTGTRPIDVGVVDGEIGTTAGDFMVRATAELLFDDGNQTGSTWAQDGIKLSESTAEWDAFETKFGEVSLLAAITAASSSRTPPIFATVTADANANADVSGPSDDNNLSVDLGDLSVGTFVDDYSFYLNGYRLRPGANVGAGFDIYPGTSLANGQVRFSEKLKANPGSPDVFMVEKWV